jgi:hypothetical protein
MVDQTECGSCPSGETCFGNRCHAVFGPALSDYWAEDFLMRSLGSDGGEGQRFRVVKGGHIEAVESALWTEGEANGAIVFYNNHPGLTLPVRWDFIVRIHVHTGD